MIGKVIKGKSFKGCISYVMDKKDAELIASEGVFAIDKESIINSFYMQSLMNPKLAKSVGHIPLSYSKEDSSRLTNAIMIQLAKEYMEMMKIENTQYIIVRHNDTEHPHCHIIFNRVNNEGKNISDKNDYARNEKVTKALKAKYNLTFGESKEKVNTQKLNDPDKVKYELYKAIKSALEESTEWIQFHGKLKRQGVNIQFKYKGKSGEIQGMSFKKGDYCFKGSEIDRNFSYSKINNQLRINKYAEDLKNEKKEINNQNTSSTNNHIFDFILDIPTGTIQPHGEDIEELQFIQQVEREENNRKWKAKVKKRKRGNGIK